MVLKSTAAGSNSVYQVSGSNTSRSLPDWIAKKRKKQLKNDLDYQTRIELIQEFEFSEASNKIKVSPDGQYAMATGTYKPQIHVYDFANLSLKFERHTDSENVDFVILSTDWTKSIHLQNDRSIEFQTKGGIHYKTRIPKFGRSMVYNDVNCDLLVGASGNEIYRLNLDQGRFLNPYVLDTELGVNSVDINPVHGLIAAGLEDGSVEFWDPRSRQRAAKLLVDAQTNDSINITSTVFRKDGINFACGTSNGKTLIYDLRSSIPTIVKDHGFGFDIKKIIWLDENKAESNKILVSDKTIAKIWDRNDGKLFASMEPNVDINDVEYVKESGMFFMANEGIPMHTYYIPNLGPSPKWCSFLDNVTEELEEKPSDTVYSNYRFVTKDELSKLNLEHLIGSKYLRSYMHGYFIHTEFYDSVTSLSKSSSSREQREKEIKNKIAKERESRIRTTGAITNTKIKVNKDFALKIKEKAGSKAAEDLVNDERFSEMFTNPDLMIDEESHDYKQINPVRSANKDVTTTKARALTAAEESDEERMHNKNDSESDQSDSDSESESEEDESEKELIKKEKVKKQLEKLRNKEKANKETENFLNELNVLSSDINIKDKQSIAFGTQAKNLNRIAKKERQDKQDIRIRRSARGEAELTFVPKKQQKKSKVQFDVDDDGEGKRDSGKTKQQFEGRRRASRNTFRGM